MKGLGVRIFLPPQLNIRLRLSTQNLALASRRHRRRHFLTAAESSPINVLILKNPTNFPNRLRGLTPFPLLLRAFGGVSLRTCRGGSGLVLVRNRQFESFSTRPEGEGSGVRADHRRRHNPNFTCEIEECEEICEQRKSFRVVFRKSMDQLWYEQPANGALSHQFPTFSHNTTPVTVTPPTRVGGVVSVS
jgi:hypothetical protein